MSEINGVNRVNVICLGVRSMTTALSFYRALGFTTSETDANPPVVFFENNGSVLELFPLAALAADIDDANPPALSTGGFPGFTLAINCRDIAEVDAVMAHAIRCGATLAKPAQTVFWGGYSGYFQDPDGYYWEVAYNPEIQPLAG